MVTSHGIAFYVDIPSDLSNILRKEFWVARLVCACGRCTLAEIKKVSALSSKEQRFSNCGGGMPMPDIVAINHLVNRHLC